MKSKFQDKEKLIEYLSVIRDAELSKPADKADKELVEACVGLLLDLQNKSADLTPEQIDEMVNRIPFIDTEKIVKIKKKKVNKLKLLLIAAIIPILITILTLAVIANIDLSFREKFKEMFGSVLNAPIGETYNNDNIEFGRVDANNYKAIEEFAKNYDIDILIPDQKSAMYRIIYISYMTFPAGDEIYVTFEDENLNYTIFLYDALSNELKNSEYTKTTINGIECYIIDLSDVGQYQVYFIHDGHTYRFNHNDLDAIVDLIENMEELK